MTTNHDERWGFRNCWGKVNIEPLIRFRLFSTIFRRWLLLSQHVNSAVEKSLNPKWVVTRKRLRCSRKLIIVSRWSRRQTNGNRKCKELKLIYLHGRRESFVNIFGAIAGCNHQVVRAFGFTVQHSLGVNCSVWDDLEVVVITCGYAVLDATVIACEKKWKETEKSLEKTFLQSRI